MSMYSSDRRTVLSRVVSFVGFGMLFAPGHIHADQVIPDDVIIQGSLAVGLDTVNGESFGSNTILLKENNLRIRFDDTSAAGFPANDWQLTANDDVSGGANKFSIEDITGSTIPFTLTAGAPTNSMFLDSTGRLGLRTGSPLLDIHMATGNTPAIRLDQTAASGFTAQTWDVGGNEANFFVRDVTGGSRLPFRIRPGAPTSSIDINASGFVGVGTNSPGAQIHARMSALSGSEALARFEITDDAVARFEINNASSSDSIFLPRLQGRSAGQNAALIMEGLITTDTGVSPAIVYNGTLLPSGGALATRPLVVYRNNNVAKVTIAANGNVTATSFISSSSRTLKDNIVDLDSQKASDALRQLTPVEFTYKDDATRDNRVGFIAEDVPEIIAEADRKSVPVMDVVALVTKVVKDQQQTIDRQKTTIARQQEEFDSQKATIARQQQELESLKKSMNDRQRATEERFSRLEQMLNGK